MRLHGFIVSTVLAFVGTDFGQIYYQLDVTKKN